MDYHPICKKNLCRICHADTYEQMQKEDASTLPGYMRTTSLSRNRLIARAIESPKKRALPFPLRLNGLGIMRLPLEVRLQIYRDCIHDCDSGVTRICGWVKGGGLHADDRLDKYDKTSNALILYASQRFTATILRLSKAIYAEARDEIYRDIRFRIEAKVPHKHLPQVNYWLTEHPMRFMRHLSIMMAFPLGSLPSNTSSSTGSDLFAKGQRRVLSIDDMQLLGKMLHKMPNMRRAEIFLRLNSCVARSTSWVAVLEKCLKDQRHITRLKSFRDSMPSSVELSLSVSFSDWNFGRTLRTGRQREQCEKAYEKVVARLRENGFAVEVNKATPCSKAQSPWGV
jgi:hypothetical protein